MTNNQKAAAMTAKTPKVTEELNLAVAHVDLNAESIVASGLFYNRV